VSASTRKTHIHICRGCQRFNTTKLLRRPVIRQLATYSMK